MRWRVSHLGQTRLLNYNQISYHVADQNYLLTQIPWKIYYYWWCNIQQICGMLIMKVFSAEVVAKCCSKPLQLSLPRQHHNNTSILTFWRGYFKDKKLCVYLPHKKDITTLMTHYNKVRLMACFTQKDFQYIYWVWWFVIKTHSLPPNTKLALCTHFMISGLTWCIT